ncbi:MAG: hypothetical protein U0172_05350 [Nitrospiraceae bacterium]
MPKASWWGACSVATIVLGYTAGLAWADCPSGVREATPGELTFAAKAEAALAAALPAPIPNSERRGAPYAFTPKPSLSFCKGEAEGAFTPGFSGSYLYKFPKADADRLYAEQKAILKQIDELEALPPEKQAEQKQLWADMRTAYDAAPRRSRKDPPFTAEQQAEVNRANAEGKKFEDAAKKLVTDHQASVKSKTDPLREQAKRLETGPQELAVRFGMNVARFPDAGPNLATFGTPASGKSAGLRIHNIVVEVAGPDGAARQALFDAVDKGYLQGLIGQAPPDIDASKSRATQSR